MGVSDDHPPMTPPWLPWPKQSSSDKGEVHACNGELSLNRKDMPDVASVPSSSSQARRPRAAPHHRKCPFQLVSEGSGCRRPRR
jgi:hypothetical protein